MSKIEIKDWRDASVIYSHTCDGNSIKTTVEKALSGRVCLNYAKLNGAELNDAELNDAELNCAKLNGAKLNNAELNRAELNDAKLNYAKLNGAKLNYARMNYAQLNGVELNYAELNYAKLPKKDIFMPERFSIHIRADTISIGCQKNKPVGFWEKMTVEFAEKEFEAGEWWKKWKPIVLFMSKQLKEQDDE